MFHYMTLKLHPSFYDEQTADLTYSFESLLRVPINFRNTSIAAVLKRIKSLLSFCVQTQSSLNHTKYTVL